MSNTKFTPGPWRLSHHESNISKVYTEGGDLIADCTIGQGQYPYNAKLIAAAPELLEALKELTSLAPDHSLLPTDFDNDLMNAIKKAEAAINKATN